MSTMLTVQLHMWHALALQDLDTPHGTRSKPDQHSKACTYYYNIMYIYSKPRFRASH